MPIIPKEWHSAARSAPHASRPENTRSRIQSVEYFLVPDRRGIFETAIDNANHGGPIFHRAKNIALNSWSPDGDTGGMVGGIRKCRSNKKHLHPNDPLMSAR